MVKPNLLIVGCQKSGTTWLHQALALSPQIFASNPKELNFFNHRDIDDGFVNYLEHFPEQSSSVKYYMESTPHYFQLPNSRIDIAQNIISYLGSPKIIVIFRNPVDRYESAYIHHMMMGRIPYTEIITSFDKSHKMLQLGHYARILRHWQSVFPDIKVEFYDRLHQDRTGLIEDIMSFLELKNDIDPDRLDFRTNDKSIKISKMSADWTAIPKLGKDLRLKLIKYYKPHVRELSALFQNKLDHWLTVKEES